MRQLADRQQQGFGRVKDGVSLIPPPTPAPRTKADTIRHVPDRVIDNPPNPIFDSAPAGEAETNKHKVGEFQQLKCTSERPPRSRPPQLLARSDHQLAAPAKLIEDEGYQRNTRARARP